MNNKGNHQAGPQKPSQTPPQANPTCSSFAVNWTEQTNCLFAALLFSVQSSLLTYFFYTITLSGLWFIWLIADIVILIHLTYIFIVTYARRRIKGRGLMIERHLPYDYPGDLPFGYAFWILYSAALVGRWAWLIKWYTGSFAEYSTNAFGSSLLQIVIAMTVGVLYFFLKSISLSRDSLPSVREAYSNAPRHGSWALNGVWFRESLNFLDAIDLMSVLLVPSQRALLAMGVEDAILAFAGVAYVAPIFHLAVYSSTKFTHLTTTGAILRLIYAILDFLFIEIPFFTLRLYIWRNSLSIISGFLVKNVIFMWLDMSVVFSTISIRTEPVKQSSSQPPISDNQSRMINGRLV